MQDVFRASDQLLRREVAIKMPLNASALKRFERSAQMSARVNNRFVAKTLDYIEENGLNYLVEELVVGKDLSELLKGTANGFDPYLVAKVLHQTSIGIKASHDQGVVHRDLKPSNVMIQGGYDFEAVKVTDFGIAKMAEVELDEAVAGGEESITASQTAVGALPYMAPEMITSVKDASFAADIWSVGAMAYELLSGRKPFGSGWLAVPRILAGQYQPAVPQISKPQFAPLGNSILALIQACLTVDPTQRPTAAQLVQRCESLCYSEAPRRTGVVSSVHHGAWGFINSGAGSFFFNNRSAYGANSLSVGDRVLFSAFAGGGADRAFPLIRLK
jgi:serine/threonine-protein kinase